MPLPDQPNHTPIPRHLKRWNWGAFFLNWIWGLGNSTYIALLMFVPFVNIIMVFVLGAKGSEWAWKNKLWRDEAEFIRVQRNWARAGWIVVLLIIAAVYFLFSSFRSNQAYIDSLAHLQKSPAAAEVMGAPITDGWLMQAHIQISGNGGGSAQFDIPVSGPDCSGTLYSRATRENGDWHIFLLVLKTECQPELIVLINERNIPIRNASPSGTNL